MGSARHSSLTHCCLFFALPLMVVSLSSRRSSAQSAPLRIGAITVKAGDVYSEKESARGGLFRLADKIHLETRPAVIRKFLLFHEGDRFDVAVLRETERNLRGLGFLRAASVTAGPPHDGVVDVLVETSDAWSLQPGTNAGSRGGASTFGFDLTDNNVAGSGTSASVSYDRGSERSRVALDLKDPAFLRPYWRAQLTYSRNSDGFEHRLALGQPFYSITTRRSANLSWIDERRDDRLYRLGQVSSTLTQNHRQLDASWATALQATSEAATRLGLGARLIDDRFQSESRAALPARSFRYLFMNLSRVQSRFITWNFVDEDVRYQDFNLGREVSIEAAVSPKAIGAPRTTEFIRASGSWGALHGERAFFLAQGSFQTRLDRGMQNRIASISGRYVRRWETRVPQTFVARLLINQGTNLDPEIQYAADGKSGLRGYRLHAFEGSGNLIFNVEQRMFFGREVLGILSPAVVAFADIGKATDRALFRTSELKSDVGFGVRIGLPRTKGNLIRIDLAFPLQPDPLGRRGPLLSFSSSQAF